MAGVPYRSAEMLNQSLEGLGQSLRQRRQDKATADYRQQMLDRELERDKTATARYDAQQAHWNKMEDAQQNAADKQQEAAENADKQKFLATIISLNTTGQLKDLDSVNKWLANDKHYGAAGIQLTKPSQEPEKQVGQSAVAAALKNANDWRNKAATSQDDTEQKRFQGYADNLEKWANLQANPPKNENLDQPEVTETEDTPAQLEQPATPAVPERKGFLGIGSRPGQPAQPAIPGHGVIKRVTKFPRGVTPPPIGGAPTPTTPVSPLAPPDAPDASATPFSGLQPPPGAQPARVRVRHKVTGQVGTIPANQLPQAQSQGYEVVQ